MTATTSERDADAALLRRLESALRLVTVPFPHFAGLVRLVRICLDERVPTMGVFASGRLAVNPGFARALPENELIFVLAHEVFHLALRTHERAAGSDPMQFNIAHDYIINDMLRVELGFPRIPAGGLDWPGARALSAEEILLHLQKDPQRRSRGGAGVWQAAAVAGGTGPQGDVLDARLERDWYPAEEQTQAQSEAVREAAARGLSLGQMMGAMAGKGRGTGEGAAGQLVTALRGLYRTPWELALQRWLESVAPGPRTFLRPSRRGADRHDVVLPGRRREGWILNVVLDTSGSMSGVLPSALGAIGDFAEAAGVEQVRLVQCDAAVTSDRFLQPAELARQDVAGYGGSDLGPALRHLADDPEVEAVLVLTDGDIAYPADEMPYDVLWVLPAPAPLFDPPYGLVIHMQPA